MLFRCRAASLVLLLPLLAACGGKASVDDTDPDKGQAGQGRGGSGAAGSGNKAGASATGGSASGGSNSGGSGAGGTGGAEQCSRYDDESPVPVNVVMINKTSRPIYLGQQTTTCGVAPLFTVADGSGKLLPGVSGCRASCVGVRLQGVGGCPAVCFFPNGVTLAPGQMHSEQWSALYRVDGTLPQSCVSFDTGQDEVTCDQAKRVQAGKYTFHAVAGELQDCTQTTGDNSCSECKPDPNGGCSTPGALIGGKLIETEATVLLDESYGFYNEVATNPSPGAGDAAPGAVATAEVQLIFTE